MSDGDWITHDGGPCPVPHDTLVQVRFRDGTYSVQQPGCTAGYWDGAGSVSASCWLADRDNPYTDIIAYRVVSA